MCCTNSHGVTLSQVRSIEAEKESLLTNNRSVAEYNLTKQPHLTQAKRRLTDCYEQAVTLQKQFEQDKQKLGQSRNWVSRVSGPVEKLGQLKNLVSRLVQVTLGEDYKRFSSMSRCSTHNLCSEMT